MACEKKTVNKIVEVLNSKSAEDIMVLNVEGLTTLTDYFVYRFIFTRHMLLSSVLLKMFVYNLFCFVFIMYKI